MKDILKKYAVACGVALLVGFFIGKVYTWDSILLDCKVLGMTRYGNLPMGCRIGEVYK